MTNEYILERIDELEYVDPLNLKQFFTNSSEDLLSDFYAAAAMDPKKEKRITSIDSIKKYQFQTFDKAVIINGLTKLLFDYYLFNFEFAAFKDDKEIDKFIDRICNIIDLFHYKAIPNKELSQYKLAEGGLAPLYHELRVKSDYTYLKEYCQYCVGTSYSALFSFLLSKRLVEQAVSLYKKNPSYITVDFFIDSFTKHFSENVDALDKTICQLIVSESEKVNLNSYYNNKQLKEFLDGRNVKMLSIEEQEYVIDLGRKHANYKVINLLFEAYEFCKYFVQKATVNPKLNSLFDGMDKSFESENENYLSWPWLDFFSKLKLIEYKEEMPNEFWQLIGRTTQRTIDSEEEKTLQLAARETCLLEIGNDYRCLLENILKFLNKNRPFFETDKEVKIFLIDLLDHYKNIVDITAKKECSIMQIGEFVEKVNERNEKLASKLFDEMLKNRHKPLTNEEIDEHCKLFFEMNKDETGDHISSETSQKLITKLNSVPTIKNRIAAGEIMFLPYAEIDEDLVSGDFTGLVVGQIKVVETYLKEVIIHYARYKRLNIQIDYNNRKEITLTPYRMSVDSKTKPILVVNDNTDALDLSEGSCSVEIGSCIFFIRKNLRDLSNMVDISKSAFQHGQLQHKWVDTVRNKYMHVIPISSLDEAKEKLAKTSYWLLRVIDELKLL